MTYPPKTRLYRFFEIVPGALLWGTLLGAMLLSYFQPLWALYAIIVFDLYWLIRVLYFVFYLTVSYRRLRESTATDWFSHVETIAGWEKILHVVFLPTYKEGIEVLTATLNGLSQVHYPLNNIMVVLAGEERDQENFSRMAEHLKEEFGARFFRFVITVHPKGLPGETPGKGSNLNFAGHRVKELLDEVGIAYDRVIASAFDCDTVPHQEYFSLLSYKYLTVENPLRTSYQPIPVFNNNIWDAPAFLRVAALSTTFWYMNEFVREEKLWTFSSHSIPFQALVDVDFWQKDVVNEDTRILLQCFMRYDGKYRVTPLYITVSMDTVNAETYFKSHVALYKQQRRWAWGGAEHIPFMATHFFKNPQIPMIKKLRWLWIVFEGIHSWATAPLLIFILGRMPFWFGGGAIGASVLYQTTPRILEWLMRTAMVGIFFSIFLTYRMLPKAPLQYSVGKRAGIFLQWILLPVSLILFSALPAIDAQTRLMLGRYLGFNVTKKIRKAAHAPQGDAAHAPL